MNIGGYLDAKNSSNLAKWRWRWHLQGGSAHWTARSLVDLRNDEDRKRYRIIELLRRRSPFGRRIVNLAAWRFERERQKATRQRTGAIRA